VITFRIKYIYVYKQIAHFVVGLRIIGALNGTDYGVDI
jgi:hypothetical protein